MSLKSDESHMRVKKQNLAKTSIIYYPSLIYFWTDELIMLHLLSISNSVQGPFPVSLSSQSTVLINLSNHKCVLHTL